jgi:hypothetical protein
MKSFMLEMGGFRLSFDCRLFLRRPFSLCRQCVEIVASLFKQAFFDKSLNGVEDFLARFHIVAASLEEFMQVERLFLHLLEHAQHAPLRLVNH